MNLGKVLNLITENNINPEDVFKLVDKVKTMDLKNEDNIRDVIHEVSKIANKWRFNKYDLNKSYFCNDVNML